MDNGTATQETGSIVRKTRSQTNGNGVSGGDTVTTVSNGHRPAPRPYKCRYTTESPALLVKVFSTEGLSKRIFRDVSFNDVLRASLVCKQWRDKSRNYLRHSKTSAITIRLHEETVESHVKSFVETMRYCNKFPVSTLQLRMLETRNGKVHSCSSAIVVNTELKFKLSLLDKFDVIQLIVTDPLEYHDDNCELFSLLKYVVQRLSRKELEYLHSGVHYFYNVFMHGKDLMETKFMFHKLKVFAGLTRHLTAPLDRNYGHEVFESTALKKFFQPIYSQQLYPILEKSQGHTLKICDFYGTNNLPILILLKEEKPKLSSFVFYGFGSPKERLSFNPADCLDFVMILKDLFKSSCKTLVEFRTNLPVFNAVCQNCNSVLANLKVLDLHYEPDNFDILGHVALDRMFPSLVTVYIRAHYDHDTKLIVPNLFYEWDYLELVPSLTVRNLIVQLNMVDSGNEAKNKFQPAQLQLLAAAFPRVENFSIHQQAGSQEEDFTAIIKSLMGTPWTELRRLEIVSCFGFEALESVLLGISSEECSVWERVARRLDLSKLEFAPTFSSIRDFPNLKFYKFLRATTEEAEARKPSPVASDDCRTSYIYSLHNEAEDLVNYQKRGNDDLVDHFWSEDSELPNAVNGHSGARFQVLGPCLFSRIENFHYFIKSNSD